MQIKIQYSVLSLTDEDIKKNSVLQIEQEQDIISPKLGAISYQDKCETCGFNIQQCPCHMGYIQGKLGYYHPLYRRVILKLLKTLCIKCMHIEGICECQAPIHFEYTELNNVLIYVTAKKNQLKDCCAILNIKSEKLNSTQEVKLNPLFVQKIFNHLIINGDIQSLPYSAKFLQSLILTCIPVISNRFRISQPELNVISQTNVVYNKLLQANSVIDIDMKDDIFFEVNQAQNFNLIKYYYCIYALMYNKPDEDVLHRIGIEKTDTMISVLNASLGKDGFFRANLNGVRVNRSCRTVITPNPYLKCNTFICPQNIAKYITVPIRVNQQNIDYLYTLVKNFPEYPCVLYVNNNTNINEKNKDNIVLIPGDVVYRQVMDNDIAMCNRYPSVREESFGGGKVVIAPNQQSIQLNVSIIEKFNADFDGDEMQLFFMASPDDNLEIALLSSVYTQFIEYTSNTNIVGGAPDLDKGIYHIKDIIEHGQKDLYFMTEDLQKELNKYIDFIDNYDDGDIVIKDKKLESFDKSIADSGSKFLTNISKLYGNSKAISLIDNILQLCFKINEFRCFSFYSNIFHQADKEQFKIETNRMKECSNLLQKYYSGNFDAPLGVDKFKFFIKYLESTLSINQQLQNGMLENEYCKPDYIKLFNKLINKFIEQFHNAVITIGWCDDGQGTLLMNLPRLFCCYPKFSLKAEHQGYCTDGYMTGNSQTTQHLIAYEGRRQAYVRGNVISETGYMQRRVQKAFDNVYSTFNGIIMGNNKTIVSLQHGQNGYDPRQFITEEVKYDDSWNKDQKEVWDYFHSLQTICKSEGFSLEDDVIRFDIPFYTLSNGNDDEITQKELDAILSCRMTEEMSDEFRAIQYQQAFNFFAYCFLTKKLVKSKKNEFEIVKKYIQSLISPGDTIGVKSAMAVTSPLSQETLDSIHAVKTKGGLIQYIQEDKLGGPQRFLELTQAQNEFTQFHGSLLIHKSETDFTKFIQKYQTLQFSKLRPQIDIFYQKKSWQMVISFQFDVLSYNNISLRILTEQLQQYLSTKDIQIEYKSKKEIQLVCIFSQSVEQITLSQQRTELLNSWIFGSKIFYNLYTKDDKIYGNIYPGKEMLVFQIPQLDPYSIYISSIPFYEQYFGINTTEHQLYNQYNLNLNNMSSTKGTQQAFYQLFASFQTQLGLYQGFSRNEYKKDNNRDFIQNIIYEEGTAFIQKAVQKLQWYATDSYQNTQIFGTEGCAGTSISEIYL